MFFSNQIFGGFLSFGPTVASHPPITRAQLPHVDRGLPASVQCSGLYLLWLIQALLPTGWQKIAIWQPLEKSEFSVKVPCILTWFWRTFWRWGRQPRVIGLIVWTLWTTQHNRLCANQVAWPSSSSTISDYVLLHTVCFLSWSTGINTAQYQFWPSFWLFVIM